MCTDNINCSHNDPARPRVTVVPLLSQGVHSVQSPRCCHGSLCAETVSGTQGAGRFRPIVVLTRLCLPPADDILQQMSPEEMDVIASEKASTTVGTVTKEDLHESKYM